MGDLILILPIAAIISYQVIPPLYKNKQKKEIVLYLLFLSIGIGLLTLIAFGVDLPSPAKLIIFLFKPATDWIMHFFK